jgi:hypothetical protein
MKWKTFWRDNCPNIEDALFDTLKRIFPDAQDRWLKGMAAVLTVHTIVSFLQKHRPLHNDVTMLDTREERWSW